MLAYALGQLGKAVALIGGVGAVGLPTLSMLQSSGVDLGLSAAAGGALFAELGRVLELDVPAKLERDVASVRTDRDRVFVIASREGTAAGTVSLWDHKGKGDDR